MRVSLASSFPIHVPVDLHYQPTSYVADWCTTASVVQNIVGDARRVVVHQHLAARHLARAMPAWMLEDRLPRARREAVVARDPLRNSCGEYLPPYRRGEMEIARIVVATTPRVIYSVRGRVIDMRERERYQGETWGWPQRVSHRVVDEHGSRFVLSHGEVPELMSLYDVILTIDGLTAPHLACEDSRLPFPEQLLLTGMLEHWGSAPPHRLVQISSLVYPQLGVFYRTRLSWWVAQYMAPSSYRVRQAARLAESVESWWEPRA